MQKFCLNCDMHHIVVIFLLFLRRTLRRPQLCLVPVGVATPPVLEEPSNRAVLLLDSFGAGLSAHLHHLENLISDSEQVINAH